MVGRVLGPRNEGLSVDALRALAAFRSSVSAAYAGRLVGLHVFGSRARGEARSDSDLDVAVVLVDDEIDHFHERIRLADLAYDAIVETGVHVQPWPVTTREWREPGAHRNPALVSSMRRDAALARA